MTSRGNSKGGFAGPQSRRAALAKGIRAEEREATERHSVTRLIRATHHEMDAQLVASILGHPLVPDGMKKVAEPLRRWLVDNPSKVFGSATRTRLDRYAFCLRMAEKRVAEGRPAWEDSPEEVRAERVERRRREFVVRTLHRATYEEKRARTVPAWLRGEAEPMPVPPGRKRS